MVDCLNCGRKFAICLTCPKCLQLYCSGCMGDLNFEVRLHPLKNQYDPDGEWKRVCKNCYLTRPANNHNNEGMLRNLTEEFNERRNKYRENREGETKILEDRLELLMKYNPSTEPLINYEKRVVEWVLDEAVKSCKECRREFSKFLLQRKHHCRLCGMVICGDCSRFLLVRVSKNLINNTRVCCKCDSLVMHRKNLEIPVGDQHLPAHFSKYFFLKQQITGLMPRYKDLLERCRDGISNEKINLQDTFIEAEAARNTIMLQFVHYEAIVKTILDSINKDETGAKYDRMLKENIVRAAQLFLKQNLLSLQLLPIYEELEKQKNEYKTKLDHQRQLEELALISNQSKATSPSLIHSIYNLMEKKLSLSQDIQITEDEHTGETGGILLANLQALLDKYRILKEQETQLETMINNASSEDTLVLREALQECKYELDITTKTLNNVHKKDKV